MITELNITIGALIIGCIMIAFANWKSRQPYNPGTLPLISYNGVQFIALIIVFLAAAHLITLLTGQPFLGRGGF